jgi:hypothetical protein
MTAVLKELDLSLILIIKKSTYVNKIEVENLTPSGEQ